jgi:magnesium-protoporphyrin O-methyltransferase
VWERLTSDAPVSRIRQTVREGRDRMRALMLSRLPPTCAARGCWMRAAAPGMMTAELAARGADVWRSTSRRSWSDRAAACGRRCARR